MPCCQFRAILKEGIPIPGGGGEPATIVMGIGITIGGGGSAITAGRTGFVSIPFDGTITGWDIVGDVAGSISVDIVKRNAGVPTSTDKISASSPVALAASQLVQNGSLAGWTTAIAAGDVLGFNVASASGVSTVTITLEVTRLVMSPIITALGITIGGAGTAITAGRTGLASIPFDGTITGWDVVGDVAGSISVDLFKRNGAVPNNTTDKISGSSPVALAGSQLAQNGSLAGWTTAIAAGDVLGFSVASASGLSTATITLEITRS